METATHQGKSCHIVREARQGDPGFNEKNNQVLVEYEDGTRAVAAPDEVYGRKKNQAGGAVLASKPKYQGKSVNVVRPAQSGDLGWDDGKDQVLVTLEDGTQKVVLRSEVTE